MLKLGRVTKVKVLFLVLVFVFNFGLFKFSAAILEKGLLNPCFMCGRNSEKYRRKQLFPLQFSVNPIGATSGYFVLRKLKLICDPFRRR